VPSQDKSHKQADATGEVGPSSMQSEIEAEATGTSTTERERSAAQRAVEGGDRPPASAGGLRLPFPGWLTEPAGKRLLWIGGLGAMATVGLLEWPVAVAVGAGSLIAERLARETSQAQPPGTAER
jgi:hypothetical protein